MGTGHERKTVHDTALCLDGCRVPLGPSCLRRRSTPTVTRRHGQQVKQCRHQHGRRARAKSSSVSSRVAHTSRVELLATAQWTAGRDSVDALHPFGLKLATHVAELPEALATLGLSGCQAARLPGCQAPQALAPLAPSGGADGRGGLTASSWGWSCRSRGEKPAELHRWTCNEADGARACPPKRNDSLVPNYCDSRP